jgi:hypothetical protein
MIELCTEKNQDSRKFLNSVLIDAQSMNYGFVVSIRMNYPISSYYVTFEHQCSTLHIFSEGRPYYSPVTDCDVT